MADDKLQIRRRHLPHWTLADATYFITFRLASGALTCTERRIVLEHIRDGHERFYLLAAAVVMPDHVHLLLRLTEGYTLARVNKGIKGASARLINHARVSTGTIWQEESWDRIVRDAAEYDEKLEYMANNPVKAGIVADVLEYKGWFVNPDFA